MDRDKTYNLLAESEVNRLVEISFFNDALNFEASTRYPAAIRYVDESEFYVAVPVDKPEDLAQWNADVKQHEDNVLKGKRVTVFPLDISFIVKFSFYDESVGHVLGFSKAEIRPRRFLRIAFDEKILLSIIDGGDQSTEDITRETIEVHALNLSGSGIAIRCPQQSGLALGMHCLLKIRHPQFPGYDPTQGTATLKGKVVRVFADQNVPDWENFGIQFVFDDMSAEFVETYVLHGFCRQIAFPESANDQGDQENKDYEVLALTANLNASSDVDTILFRINNSAAELVSSEASSILLFDENDDQQSYLSFKTTLGEKSPILSRIKVSDGIAWWVAQTGEPAVVNDISSDPRFSGAVDSITGFKTRSMVAVPIVWEGTVLGVLQAVNKIAGGRFSQLDLQRLTPLTDQIAVAIKNTQMMGKYENFFTNAIELTVKAIESVGVLMKLISPGHCWRVAALATAIGQQFGMSEQEFDDLYYAAVLHDIGLLEPKNQKAFQFGYAYEAENDFAGEHLKSHAVTGANMIKEIQMLRGAAPFIRHHHEHFNGMGYPDRLEGERIPLGARVIAVAEAYEEMLYGRENDVSAQEKAVSAIKSGTGTRFDPEVIEVFIKQVTQ